MVERGLGQVGTPGAQAARVELGESLRRGDLVDQVQVDVEDRGRRVALWGDDVGIPQLVEQGLAPRCGLRRWRRDAAADAYACRGWPPRARPARLPRARRCRYPRPVARCQLVR